MTTLSGESCGRLAKCLLKNDHWCKSLGQAQPKSEAWLQFRAIRTARKERESLDRAVVQTVEAMSLDLALDGQPSS